MARSTKRPAPARPAPARPAQRRSIPAHPPPAPSRARPESRWQETALWSALIVVITLLAYLPALRGGFIWDDDAYVTNNTTLRDLGGLGRIWLEPTSVPQYYPLVFTTFWVDYHLWGLSPLGYHLVNALLHAASAVLLWRLLARLAVPGAWLAAAVFALHPVHVESVAWITERKNVLSGLFYLGAFHAYWSFAVAPPGARPLHRWRWYAASLALFGCALLSKTVTSSLPAALLLALWWKRDRLTARDLYPLVPLFVLGAGFGLLTAWLEKHHVGAQGEDWALTFVERCLVAGRALWFYVAKIVWPHPLIFIYPRWRLDPAAWWQVLLPAAAIAVLVAGWLLRTRTGKGPLAAALYFAATLLPALGFFNIYPMRYSFVADHFQYLASIGPIALLAALATEAERRLRPPREVGWLAAAVLLLALGALTWQQGHVYKDLETLWRDTIAKNPDAGMAHDNLANILLARGKNAEAVEHYREALRVKPNHLEAHNNMGAALQRLGKFDEAIEHLREAIRIEPVFSDPHFNLGVTYATQGKVPEAITEYSEAIRIQPRHAQAHNNLGSLLFGQGRTQEAIEHFSAAVRAKPDFPEARANLGHAFSRSGDLDAAAREYATAMRLRPSYASAQNGLALVYARQGKAAQAMQLLRDALRARPDWPEAEKNLAWMLATSQDATLRNGAEAVRLAERASHQTGGKDLATLDTLAAAYAEASRFQEAVQTAENAFGIAETSGKSVHAEAIRARVSAYRLSQPLHDGSAPPG